MNNSDAAQLIFIYGFDERDQFEAECRGYIGHVRFLLAGSQSYAISFFTPGRLAQDLEEAIKRGEKFIAEPGMIVIPEITLENMNDAVNELEKQGFFNHLVPVTSDKS